MELTKEQAAEVLKDFSEYFDSKVLEDSMFEAYLNHKFPQKFKNGDIVKHKTGAMVYITDFEKCEGFGFKDNGVFEVRKDWIFKNNYWQLADHKEWSDKLLKESKRRGLVEGVKVKCLYNGKIYEINSTDNYTERGLKHDLWFDDRFEVGICVMNNGEWAKPLSKLDLKIEELKELAREEKMEIEVIFKNK